MKLVIQRVRKASITIENVVTAEIDVGLVVFVGVAREDKLQDAEYLAGKLTGLRVFPDAEGKLNLSVEQTQGEVLIISNFTLYGDTKKGKRPSFDRAAAPEVARPLYEHFVTQVRSYGIRVATGVFQAHMEVMLVNSGPVTLICESIRDRDQ